jgi:hypothetical protein
MRLLHIVEDTPIIIHGKNKKKINDRFFLATSSRMSLTKSVLPMSVYDVEKIYFHLFNSSEVLSIFVIVIFCLLIFAPKVSTKLSRLPLFVSVESLVSDPGLHASITFTGLKEH